MSADHRVPLGYVLLSVVAGASVAFQARFNSDLAEALDDGVYAAFLSFTVGLVIVAAIALATTRGRAGLRALGPSLRGGRLQWWQLAGGLGGATFIVAQSVTVATIGVALFTVCTVAGQTTGGAAVDRAGLSPGGVRPITAPRVIASVVCIVAVALAVSGRTGGEARPLYITLALVAGLVIAVQAAINAQVGLATGSAVVSSLVNFVVGWVAIGLVVAAQHLASGEPLATPPSVADEPLLWLGGPIGVGFTVVLAIAVRHLGALVFALASIAGTLGAAVLVDGLSADAPDLTATLVAGVLLTFAAVVVAGLPPRRTPRVVGQDDAS